MDSRTLRLSLLMLATMAVSTVPLFAMAVVASELQDEFNISKFDLGVLAALNTGIGALTAPFFGKIADTIGARNSVGLTLALSAVSAIMLALAPNFALLAVASAIGGLPQGSGNPACNKAISVGVDQAKRGVSTGIKQSGVQAGVALAGFSTPILSANFGWRSAMWMYGVAAIVLLLGLRLVPRQNVLAPEGPSETTAASKLPTFVTQVAIYAFLLGIVGSGLGRFLPLFAEESVGFTIERAGVVFAIQGLVAVPARLLTGVALDRGASAQVMMVGMGLIGAVSLLMIAAATSSRPSLLWIGTVIAGLTLGTWNTTANLSMVRMKEAAGKATGRLMAGFFGGLTIGGPVIGWSIDQFSYTPAWLVGSGVAIAAAIVVGWRPVEQSFEGPIGTMGK